MHKCCAKYRQRMICVVGSGDMSKLSTCVDICVVGAA